MIINKDHRQTIVVFGRDGQLGRSLQKQLFNSDEPIIFLGRDDCDLSDELALCQTLKKCQARIIINAAAYTSVDQAESEVDQALAVNARAPALMASYISKEPHGVLVHYSSEYVFADTQMRAYKETDATGPIDQLSVYGKSKLLGEQAIQKAFVHQQPLSDESARYYVIRSSGIYGAGENFIKTILRLGYKQNLIRVVHDQVGVPSSADWLADMTRHIITSGADSGIYHVVPDGEVSWCEVAQFVMSAAMGLEKSPTRNPANILPITSAEYGALAKRPLNSRLNHQKFKQMWTNMGLSTSYPGWQEQVAAYVRQIIQADVVRDS